MAVKWPWASIGTLLLIAAGGCYCHQFEITTVSLSHPGEPCGLPFYLPKPLLIIAKNFRNIEERTDGLTDPVTIPNTFDSQSGYADLKANVTTSPGPSSSPAPDKSGGGGTKEAGLVRGSDGTVVQDRVLPGESPKDGATPDTLFPIISFLFRT
jgi:hypothetical protein